MAIEEFLENLGQLNLSLVVKENTLVLRGEKGKLGESEIELIRKDKLIIDFIKENKSALINHLKEKPVDAFSSKLTGNLDVIYALSPLQEGVLFHSLYDDQAGAYIIQFSCDLFDLHVAHFRRCWEYLLRKHTVLRTSFNYKELSVPVQCVYKQVRMPLDEQDWTTWSAADQKDRLAAFLQDDRKRGFDFNNPPLMRVNLFRLAAGHHRMVWTIHHLICDGWSMPVLMSELLQCYENLMAGKGNPVYEREDQYQDYIRYISSRDSYEEESFWRSYLSGITGPSLLPFAGVRTFQHKSANTVHRKSLYLEPATTLMLQNYVKAHHITPNTLIQGVWAYLLSSYTAADNVVYGVTVSGRPATLSAMEQRVGMYINTLPLCTRVTGDLLIADWLREIQREHNHAREYQYTSLREVQQWKGIESDFFDSILAFENFPVGEELFRNWHLKAANVEVEERTNYTLELTVTWKDALTIVFRYDEAIMAADYVELIMGHFEGILHQIVNDPALTISQLEILTPSERSQLLTGFNGLQADYPLHRSFIALFEEQAMATPDNIAVSFEGMSYSYRELDARANQLAHYLVSKGVKAEVLVGVCMDRSPAMLVSLLAIWKAGGAYLPIDPDNAPQRIQELLTDSHALLVLSTSDKMITTAATEWLMLDHHHELISSYATTRPDTDIPPDQLAYVIYTSGSTGRQKGVMIMHKGMLNHLYAKVDLLGIGEQSRVLQNAVQTFDISIWQFLVALLRGGTTYIYSQAVILHPDTFLKKLSDDQLTVVEVVPSYLQVLLERQSSLQVSLPALEYLLVTGEAFSKQLCVDWFSSFNIPVVNAYGPTEASDDITHYVMHGPPEGVTVPLGHVVPNLRIYVLDKSMKLCPVGIRGEICVAGAGVGRGYMNEPEKTAAVFVNDPFVSGSMMYRTGDIGYWQPSGVLEFAGRMDEQVKVRGYRIELGEIESVLLDSGWIKQAVVIARLDSNGQKELVAYVIPLGEVAVADIQAYLRTRLPEYMIPLLFVKMEIFPLTANGKIDRKALPEPELPVQVYVSPQTATEQALAGIWQELLKVPQIGLYDNFFDLGGHSLLAMRVLAALHKRLEVEISIRDIFTYPRLIDLAAHVSGQRKGLSLPALQVQERGEAIPLSFSQERLWFIDRLQGSVHYHIPVVLSLDGPLDEVALKGALAGIIARHEVLRTVFREEEGGVYQQVLSADNWKLKIRDAGEFEHAASLQQWLDQELVLPFDLRRDYMLRASLVRYSAEKHLLVVVLHHIAADGWSGDILVQEFTILYRAAVAGHPAMLPLLPVQYADYAIWQRTYLTAAVLEEKLSWWTARLKGVIPLNLPTDLPRPAVQSTRGAEVFCRLDASVLQGIEKICLETGSTLFMALLSVFKILLHRYSGQTDICVGTPVAGRYHAETEGLIGFFLNTLALRSEVDADMPFIDFLQAERDAALAAYAHQEVPFEQVVERVTTERDMSSNPVFQVMFVLQNATTSPEIDLGELSMTPKPNSTPHVKFDLMFIVSGTPGDYKLHISYCSDLYLPSTIERMAGHYSSLLNSVAVAPATTLGQLKMLTPSEECQLQEICNGLQADYPLHRSFVALFEEQVLATPDNIAVSFEGMSYSYRELDARVNQLAHYLVSKGVKAEVLVGVCMDRSPAMLVSLLAIWKAGGAYLPIDPDNAPQRIQELLTDSHALLVLSTSDKMITTAATEWLMLDHHHELISSYATTRPDTDIPPDQLAYVIYTSGSTGRQKGVMIMHKGMLNHLYAKVDLLGIGEQSRVLQNAVQTFDISIWQFLVALLRGGTTYIYSQAVILHPDTFLKKLSDDQLTVVEVVPSYLQVLLERQSSLQVSLPALEYLLVTGEAFSKQLCVDWFSSFNIPVVNAYGPTEASDDITHYVMHGPPEGVTVPLGHVVPNLRIYVLDKSMKLCPVGIRGEICVAGAGVGRGYMNEPEKTAAVFVNDPFVSGSMMYRTGDIGYWQPSGVLEFAGRMDEQVKVRGYRIELGEIESVLLDSGWIKQAVVIARLDSNGQKELVAYVIPLGEVAVADIQAYLRTRLPEYMIPLLFVKMEIFPLTANGKIDRKALPEPELPVQVYVSPQTATEQALAGIWQELLKVPQIGLYDNFFDLGGHSLLAMRVLAALHKRLEVEISIRDIFTYPRLIDLAAHVSGQRKGLSLPALQVQERGEAIPLSFSQERLWFIDRLQGSVHYHIPVVLSLDGPLDEVALKGALAGIIARHEVLRTVFREEEGGVYQQVLSADNWELKIRDAGEFEHAASLQQWLDQELVLPFDLRRDYMLRASLVRYSAEKHLLVVVLHHIAADGWSGDILVQEFTILYRAAVAGHPAMLPLLPVQYADYAIWQRTYLTAAVLEEKLSWWTARLKGVIPLNLPTDLPRPAVQSTRGASLSYSLDGALLPGVEKLCRETGSTPFMVLLSIFKVLLYRYSGQTDICVGTPVAGRYHGETEGLIGFFLNTLALRSEVDGDIPFIDFLQAERDAALAAYAHQEVPFEQVVERVVTERDLGRSPVFQVMFLYEPASAVSGIDLGALRVSRQSHEHTHTKFDLTFTIAATQDGYVLHISYSTDLYLPSGIMQLAGHYGTLLASALADPGCEVGLLPLLSAEEEYHLLEVLSGVTSPLLSGEEKDQVLSGMTSLCLSGEEKDQVLSGMTSLCLSGEEEDHVLSGMTSPCLSGEEKDHVLSGVTSPLLSGKGENQLPGVAPSSSSCDNTIVALFKAQVAKTPDNTAIVCGEQHLSYRELDRRATLLSVRLQQQGVQRGTIVALYLDRSVEFITGVLAILKAGGAYLPIDLSYPQQRVRYMLDSSGALLVLSTAATDVSFLEQPVLLADDESNYEERVVAINDDIQPGDLAYVIYTSGSTGQPKGVMIEHRNAVNYFVWAGRQYLQGEQLSFALYSSISFDLTCTSVFVPLLTGNTIHIYRSAGDDLLIEKVVRDGKAQVVKATPSHLKALLSVADVSGVVKRWIVGGEALSRELAASLRARFGEDSLIYNEYGPTETTIGCMVYEYAAGRHGDLPMVPIGQAAGNVRLYVLDSHRQLVPRGVSGELYIGGDGVGRGYINREDLSAERFMENPFHGGRLYRTGDLCRWLADGELEYLGRIDEQVKVRGYRIEPGEIESVLTGSGLVREAAVMARQDGDGNNRLVAYITGDPDLSMVQRHLAACLPEYMVPSLYVKLAQLPLTANGKTDKQALPEPSVEMQAYVAPRTAVERELAGIWEELLHVEQVGLYDHFFLLGGHSLLAMRVVAALQKRLETVISIRDIFTYPRLLELASYIEQQHKGLTLPPLEVQERGEHIPLSFSQERLWFIDRLQGSVHYHIPVVLQLDGPLNIPALKRALWGIVDRHEVLRTVFGEQEGQAWQQVLPSEGWELKIYDASEVVIEELVEREQHHPFDLSRDYMLRASLIRETAQQHRLSVVLHHIASDGWSGGILVQELASLYRAAVSGSPVSLPVLPVQYADYAIWQRRYLTAELLEQKLGWWAEQLKGITPLNLPADLPRPGIQSTRGSASWYDLGITLTEGVDQLSRETGSTPFMVFLSVFKILLQRYSGQTDICVGTPVAGRYHTETEGLIGFFLNTLALRSEVNVNQTFLEFLSAERDVSLAAYAHQEVPFEQVVDRVETTRDMSRSPVFQVMFVLQNTPDVAEVDLGELRVTPQVSDTTHVKQDLLFVVSRTAAGYRLHISYSTDLYLPATIERMAGHYQVLLQSAITGPSQELTALKMLSSAEEHWLLAVSHGTPADYPRDKTIVDLFAEQAAAVPDRIALVWEDVTLSYGELDARSNQLACYLRQKGVQPDTLVGICMHRGIDMIIGLLGILKAGGAYLPVDPDYPQDRIRYQLEDSGATLMITTSALATALFSDLAASRLILPERLPLEEMPSAPLPRIVQPEHLAYVIYTSGSTGKPKGVMIEHRQVVRLFVNDAPCYDFSPADTWTLFHSFCFDFSVWEIFGALLFGGKLIIVPSAVAKDSEAFGALLAAEEVTVLNQTPAAFYVLQEVLLKQRPALSLRYLIFAGEALQPGRLLQWQEAYEHCRLINMYGITEITVHATFKELHRSDVLLGVSNIGVAIPTLSALILDKWGHLSPVGCTGELYIGGDGLARGYLNRPELTASRFIADPFQSGGRLYRSGDLARRLANGEMEYQGRMDDQVKIRGYRIELGEIESVLSGSGLVHQSVILAREDGSGGKQLVAYVVPVDGLEMTVIQAYLKTRLPDYMVPSILMKMETLPLTSNGKVNKRALPEPDDSLLVNSSFVAPANETEETLCFLFKQILNIEKVGIHDNFFELSGNSLSAVRLVLAIQKQFNIEKIRLIDFFNAPTVAAVALLIEKDTGTGQRMIQLCNNENELPNMFFIPPVLGLSIMYRNLALSLAEHFNSYGMQYSGLEAEEQLGESMEAIAARLTEEVFTVQRAGKFYLTGYSFGTMIAFEMAKIIEAAGHEVTLVLIDGTPQSEREAGDEGLTDKVAIAREEERMFLEKYVTSAHRERILRLIMHHHHLLNAYITGGMITSRVIALEAKREAGEMQIWNDFTTGDFVHAFIHGTHNTVLDEEHLADLTTCILNYIS